MTTTTSPYTASQARSKARWIASYVRGAYGIQIVESFPSGEAWVKFRNPCGNERIIRNDAEFVAFRDVELGS